MADITPGLENLNNRIMKNYGNTINIGSFNDNAAADYRNISRLDDFISGDENSELLRGVVTKIQQGRPVEAGDLEGLSSENSQLIRDLQSLIDQPIGEIDPREGLHGPQAVADGFSGLLDKYLDNVNTRHKTAAKAVETFASGGDIDIHSVMIASEKASLSMKLALQLKSKLIGAYKEISNTRI